MATVNIIYIFGHYEGLCVPVTSQGSKQEEEKIEQNSLRARCEVLPAVLIKIQVFWDAEDRCSPLLIHVASCVPIDTVSYPTRNGASNFFSVSRVNLITSQDPFLSSWDILHGLGSLFKYPKCWNYIEEGQVRLLRSLLALQCHQDSGLLFVTREEDYST